MADDILDDDRRLAVAAQMANCDSCGAFSKAFTGLAMLGAGLFTLDEWRKVDALYHEAEERHRDADHPLWRAAFRGALEADRG